MKVKVTVISQQGTCNAGHQVGDSWEIANETVGGICFAAFCSLISWIHMAKFDGQTGWDIEVPCPDIDNPVIFRIEKIKD